MKSNMFLMIVTRSTASRLFCKRHPIQKSFGEPMYRTRKESQYLFSCLPFPGVNSSISFLSRRTFFIFLITKRKCHVFDLIQLDVVPIDI